MLVVYDKKGTIYFSGSGFPEPDGIPFLNIEIPEGHYFDGLDMSQEPPVPVFKECPKSELELMKEANEKQQADIDYLMLLSDSGMI